MAAAGEEDAVPVEQEPEERDWGHPRVGSGPWAGTASAGWGTCGGTCRSAAAEAAAAAVSAEAATGEAAASTTLGRHKGRGDGARSREEASKQVGGKKT